MLAVLDEREDSRRILAPGAVYEVRDASDSEPRYGPALRVTARTTGVLTASMPITIAVTDAEGKPVEAGVYILTADARVRRAFPGADRLTGALAGLARLPASGPPAGGLQTFPWLGDDASTAFVDLDQGADRATDATKTVIGADGAVAVLLTIPSVGHAWWIRVTAVASDGRTGGTDLVVR
jgi:hypothetical protein